MKERPDPILILERQAVGLESYFDTVKVMRDRADPGSYDAIYWGLELKHKGTLSSIELHRRTMRRLNAKHPPQPQELGVTTGEIELGC